MNLARNSIVSVISHSICSLNYTMDYRAYRVDQNINAMNLIWAFNFNKAKDPFTKEDKVYDLHDFARVGLC
jgi:hypothetical protein